ncbi:hypothetical protein K504DRAFT_387264 [Pleomassaria siparia CBS 279.74]|uniref:DUF8021 domain-containing protein n=1 Tax=Pleomassaria siparia CBS 279.74 TaxID=1314801 RepID=A0A6G1JZQ0_9PLEO|nr:hypothetical protein K504DRAFT_387264 [Pleomassaria siparia CBS 279.74]
MVYLKWRASIALNTLIVSALAIPYSPAVDCDRAALSEAADAYITAQTTGSLDPLQKLLSSNWTYLENNKATTPTTSVLHKALKIDHRRTNYDLVACATYTELISTTGPYTLATQIRHGADKKKIASIDTIAATTGAWLFNATKTLGYVKQESWPPIPPANRDSRAVIQAAGDAYLDMWSSTTADKLVPWGTPCVRLEGSAYTGSGSANDSCKPGIPSNHSQAPNTHRRYVIDEDMGSVSIFCVWEHMMMAADSHEFRLEGGKLRFVHTMTECGGRVCKL